MVGYICIGSVGYAGYKGCVGYVGYPGGIYKGDRRVATSVICRLG